MRVTTNDVETSYLKHKQNRTNTLLMQESKFYL